MELQLEVDQLRAGQDGEEEEDLDEEEKLEG